MFRDGRSRWSPHNLYANTSELFAQAGDSGEAVPLFQYGTPSGAPVTSIDLGIGGVSVNWDVGRDARTVHALAVGQPP